MKDIKTGQYAHTHDGKCIYIKEILENGSCRGISVNAKTDEEMIISREDIKDVADEICKLVIVE